MTFSGVLEKERQQPKTKIKHQNIHVTSSFKKKTENCRPFWLFWVQVCGDIQFLERQEGDSVDLPCTIKPRSRSPLGFYMRRTWLHPGQVLFKYTDTEAHVNVAGDRRRLEVGGDPSSHSLTVTLSDLRANDTDRYYCEFVVANPSSEDEHVPGETEFFLLVNPGEWSFVCPNVGHWGPHIRRRGEKKKKNCSLTQKVTVSQFRGVLFMTVISVTFVN